MISKLDIFQQLATLFKDNGFALFLVGGTVRDYLLKVELTDMDAVTDAIPEEMHKFLKDANYTFERFGSVSIKVDGVKFDITTMREEKAYSDSRHPGEISFVKDLSKDVIRRDFTINAMYMDNQYKVIDYVGGEQDLKQHILRMIGKPENRLREDPLRIIRALRFKLDYDLEIEPLLDKAIKANIGLLKELNLEKIKQDIRKIKCSDKSKVLHLFEEYNIKHLLDVIE